ncbi:MAG: ATP-binding protein [Mesorhizobium sp.]|uniref:ATP-binding protein n=1 Tax=Mesorhizobium sp. TaxID=1871066 RepID=UPI000FEA396B|nr:ATP-binding protein [Mesorhizobium sp.]RWH61346.1 MAG: ATP-binding protein [Mesorhizobium sp.]
MNDLSDQQDLFDPQIIPSRLAITAMRDSGYKNTAYALAELIDNAQQANATMIEVFCFQKQEFVQQRTRSRVSEIAVLDNGNGMGPLTLRMALQFGNGTRLNDRTGIGRFGMGLPNASISQARRLDVWSWQNGPDNAIHTYLDLDDIEAGTMVMVPEPSHFPLPDHWRSVSEDIGKSGTLVVWSELDMNRLTWKSAKSTLSNTARLVGRIYRHFIANDRLSIRLCAFEEGAIASDAYAVVEDPLYLIPSPTLPAPFNTMPMFREVSESFEEIEYKGVTHKVRVKYSVASQATIDQACGNDRGRTAYGAHARGNIGVSVLRAGRELMLDQGWCIGYDPRERWWGAEVEFPPAIDELFGVTNNKQAATHFAELATVDWHELAEQGDEFRDVVRRLKEEGDPRGWLLGLADSIRRNLEELRDVIKGQAAGTRSTRRTRHDDPDDVTSATNKAWKDRSKERPIEGEEKPNTPEDLAEIKTDLTENKEYSEADAEDIVALIKEADLKVIFLEAEFPDRYQLFSVEMKGNVTEVTFNRKHPAFDDIFGTINTVDEDMKALTREELIDRLTRAVNASKIIFAAWARYEREAGVDRAKALQKVRFDWGQIASQFLQPEDDL